MPYYENISAVILAGGSSTRMGVDKALMQVNDMTIIERLVMLMSDRFAEIFISANDAAAYKFLGLPVVSDFFLNAGPLAGIHAGLKSSPTDKNFIISCDLPLVDTATIDYIVGYETGRAIVIPSENGKLHTLCGVYDKKCMEYIENVFRDFNQGISGNGKTRKLSIRGLIENVGAEIINFENLPFYNKEIFFNMNDSKDYEFVRNKLSGVK